MLLFSTSIATSIPPTCVWRTASSAPSPRSERAGCLHLRAGRIYQRAEQGVREGATEFHIVGGLHPDLPFDYFLEMIRGLKQRCPAYI